MRLARPHLLVLLFFALLGLIVTVLVSLPAAAATRPEAPAPCAATLIPGTSDDYRITWTRPVRDGGAPIWRYVLKVKGQSKPVVQLSAANRTTENPTRAYTWTGPVAGSPLTFQVRAVNAAGVGAWCEAKATTGSTSPSPSPTPSPSPSPSPSPTPSPSPSPSPSTSPSPTYTPTTPAGDTTPAGRPFLPYGETSFFQSELTGAPVDAALTTRFRAFMKSHPDQAGINHPRLTGAGGNQWGIAYDLADCTDPTWKIGTVSGNTPKEWAILKTVGFHADAEFGSRFTGTSDSPFVVIDRCTGISVWAANAAKGSGNTINVSTFGAFRHDSNGLDNRNPRSTSTQNSRSRGVIPDSMLVRKDLMDYAKANRTDLGHVLELFFVETDSAAGVVHPMVGAEGGKYGFGAEGTRVAISPTVDLSSRPCSPEALVIARTLQNYGGYLGDNSGSSTMIKAEQEATAGEIWGSALQRDELAGCISWDDFVVITPGWQ